MSGVISGVVSEGVDGFESVPVTLLLSVFASFSVSDVVTLSESVPRAESEDPLEESSVLLVPGVILLSSLPSAFCVDSLSLSVSPIALGVQETKHPQIRRRHTFCQPPEHTPSVLRQL